MRLQAGNELITSNLQVKYSKMKYIQPVSHEQTPTRYLLLRHLYTRQKATYRRTRQPSKRTKETAHHFPQDVWNFSSPAMTLNFFPKNCKKTMMKNANAQIAAWMPNDVLVPCASAQVTWK